MADETVVKWLRCHLPHTHGTLRQLVLGALSAVLLAQSAWIDVQLRSPLNTVVHADVTGGYAAEVIVPPDVPPDCMISAFATDGDGDWWQRPLISALKPGRQALPIVHLYDLVAAVGGRRWPAGRPLRRNGLVIASATASRAVLRVRFDAVPEGIIPPIPGGLLDLSTDGWTVEAGQRWTLTCRPEPMPLNPFDQARFSLRLQLTDEAGTVTEVEAFYRQPMKLVDRGDREDAIPRGPARFEVRYRPTKPGRLQAQLLARWGSGQERPFPLPALEVTGKRTDPFVRVDSRDPRYFNIDGSFFWPIGINLHNPFDRRSQEVLGTALSPNRGAHGYIELLDRLHEHGIDAAEIWLSPWNLALEWRQGWPGFDGLGWYNQANAERLDAIIDRAEHHGIRLVLALQNHGQASWKDDSQWIDNPWNGANGGPCQHPEEILAVDAGAYHQEQMHRYLLARWSQSPAVMTWKLWTESDLLAGSDLLKGQWQKAAAAVFSRYDPYRHVISYHASSDFRAVIPFLAGQAAMSAININAYTDPASLPGEGTYPCDLAGFRRLMEDGVRAPVYSVLNYHKPIMITEYGGSWMAADPASLRQMLQSGPAMALTLGYGGSPLFWWWEWVDQRQYWPVVSDIRKCMEGVDLRGSLVVVNSAKPGEALPASCIMTGMVAILTVGPVEEALPNSMDADGWIPVGGRIQSRLSDNEWDIAQMAVGENSGAELRFRERVIQYRLGSSRAPVISLFKLTRKGPL